MSSALSAFKIQVLHLKQQQEKQNILKKTEKKVPSTATQPHKEHGRKTCNSIENEIKR